MTLSRAQLMVLRTLDDAAEPLFNGTLAARTGLRWNSGVFGSLKRLGLIEDHPFKLTDAGRTALVSPLQDRGQP